MIIIKTRNTFQKKIVYETVKKLKFHPTADEIYSEIKASYPSISKGTVYRNLGILSDNGSILKITVPNEADAYDFNISRHAHLLCEKCGRIFDIEAEFPDCKELIIKNNDCVIYGYSLLFYGVCSDCNNHCD